MWAYVLLKVATGSEKKVMEELKGIAGLEEIYVLFGDYDYILVLQAPDTPTLAQVITHKIRRLEGIEKTVTLLEAPI